MARGWTPDPYQTMLVLAYQIYPLERDTELVDVIVREERQANQIRKQSLQSELETLRQQDTEFAREEVPKTEKLIAQIDLRNEMLDDLHHQIEEGHFHGINHKYDDERLKLPMVISQRQHVGPIRTS